MSRLPARSALVRPTARPAVRLAGAVLALAVACAVSASPARAEPVTVGMFTPGAPFPSTTARVELASRLGEHLGRALGATPAGIGRAYVRASDFAAAVRKGEVTVALVDAIYLAGTGTGTGGAAGYTVIAVAARGGDTARPWQVLARAGTRTIAELRGKRVLVPSNGGREADLVLNALLGGAERDLFGKIEAAPDAASAVAALGLGKADAAVVPAGLDSPAGTVRVAALPALPGPVLVAYGAVSAARRAELLRAAQSFQGDATIPALTAPKDGGADAVRALARRLAAPQKRGPLLVPAVRVVAGDLLEGRALAIERAPASAFAIAPGAR
jgi:ethanolamine utilization microcompartment shell protein EutS